MSSFDELYPVHGGPFDGNQWPHYDTDKYTFGDGDYLFVRNVWCWSPRPLFVALRRIEREEREKLIDSTSIVLTLWAVLGIILLSVTAQAQGIGEHAIGQSPTGMTLQEGQTYRFTKQHTLEKADSPVGKTQDIGEHTVGQTPIGTQLSTTDTGTSKPATSDTPEARLRQAYEYCLTDFKGMQGIVMDGNHIVAASFSDPNCAKISQLWEGSQAQKQYNAELADWNRQRIAREKVLIDQVAGEGDGQSHTGPIRSKRMKQ